MSSPYNYNSTKTDNVRYEVDKNGVLVQISQGGIGGQHPNFVYDELRPQNPNRRPHRQLIPHTHMTPTADDRVDASMRAPTRPERSVTPATGSALNAPQQAPPSQARSASGTIRRGMTPSSERASSVAPSEAALRAATPIYHGPGSEDCFSSTHSKVYEWVNRVETERWETETADSRSRATTPDSCSFRYSSPYENTNRAPYQPHQAANLSQAASYRVEPYAPDNRSLSTLTELESEADNYSTARHTPGPDPERYTSSFFTQGSSRDGRVLPTGSSSPKEKPAPTRSSVKTPRKAKRDIIEPTVLTRSRAKMTTRRS